MVIWAILNTQVFAQNRTLSGTVKDAATGEALIGERYRERYYNRHCNRH